MQKSILCFSLLFCILTNIQAQEEICVTPAIQHELRSNFSDQSRTFWVSLPMNYDRAKSYPVLYVFDAEWRFELVRHIAWDLAGNKKIPHHIVVGIPHVNWETQRGIDLTFSHSVNEYDGTIVEDGYFNKKNTGGGQKFYQYLTKELVKTIDTQYSTNQERILVGHSYGGYFASYILPFDTCFNAYQIYDPSIWYNKGEVLDYLKQHQPALKSSNIFITYQPNPDFHKKKIEQLIKLLKKRSRQNGEMKFTFKKYSKETHNALFMQSFIDGMKALYPNFLLK